MGDLEKPGWMYLKAVCFFLIIIVASVILLLDSFSWMKLGLLLLIVWSSARLYYFIFYVIGNYIDEDYKFSGVMDFLKYLIRKK